MRFWSACLHANNSLYSEWPDDSGQIGKMHCFVRFFTLSSVDVAEMI